MADQDNPSGDAAGYFRKRIDEIQSLEDPEKRMIQAARLVEKIIKNHFMHKRRDRIILRALIEIREKFLGPDRFREAMYAVGIRNRVAHYTDEGVPSDTELERAAEILLSVVQFHVDSMEGRRTSWFRKKNSQGKPRRDSNEPESEPAEPTPPPVTEYATHVERPEFTRHIAADHHPKLTASTLAEYAFCPRAGVLRHESDYSDNGDELPSYGALPWFERDAIESELHQRWMNLFKYAVVFVAGLVILQLFPLSWLAFRLLLVSWSGLATYFIVREFMEWVVLSKRLVEAKWPVACHPDPDATLPEPVTWWGLLEAGFEVQRLDRPYVHGEWKLGGSPHRTLIYGDLMIPVHRVRSSSGILQPQHIVRAMTLCHLIEATIGAPSPYAVILFGDTYDGTTVPNTRENREQFYTVLERARSMIAETDAGDRIPPEPTDASTRCAGCFHGQSRKAANREKTLKHGNVVDPYFYKNARGTVFHSCCGDRFGWIPKHRRNRQMKDKE